MHARALPSVALRRSSPHDRVSPLWQVGGAGELDLEKGTKIKQRSEAGGTKGAVLATSVKLDMESAVPLADQLRLILFKNAVRVIDLFKSWDTDGDGTISKKEFRRAMVALGVSGPSGSGAVDELFDSFDFNKSGMISHKEMNKWLRSGNAVELEAKLKVRLVLST